MRPTLRKTGLTLHVAASVGWLGAVGVFFALAMAGVTTPDATLAQSTYRSMQLMTWQAILPLGIASLASGLIQSLGTPWGLFQHYWVIAKLTITLLATALLFLHTRVIDAVAAAAAVAPLAYDDHRRLRVQLVADAVAALTALTVTTALSVFKPKGVTSYGWRRQQARR